MTESDDQFDAWKPGLDSTIPARLLPLVTLYRPENSTIGYLEARELADICGLKPQETIAFTVRRLVVHELLVRVTADLHVPDGPNYEDLGIQLRGITARIRDAYVEPAMADLEERFERLRVEIDDRLRAVLDKDVFAPASAREARSGWLSWLFGKEECDQPGNQTPELRALAAWEAAIPHINSPLEKACLKGLHKIVSGIVVKRGRLMADKEVVVLLATNWVCNSYGSETIGELVDPLIREAAAKEGYTYLPFQPAPVVLNVKGSSASGKSTIRPLQRKLAQRIGVPWEHFALVSPDYWRKFLLDYKSLGGDYKYAAMLTGQELEIIDKKLDGYIERKAARSEMPHLLIDRFRFDSFGSGINQPAESRLLSRFGDTVFLYFMITPPADTVERAWTRGIETGRYKAVDDLLHHNVEAYTGMPNLFFNWIKKKQQKMHFEFLDNSISIGNDPVTIAFGWNERIIILDIEAMRRMNVYKNININARRPEDVILYSNGVKGDIIEDCITKISDVTFVDPESLKVIGHTHDGKCGFEAAGFFKRFSIHVTYANPCLENSGLKQPELTAEPLFDVEYEQKFTIGAWGRQ